MFGPVSLAIPTLVIHGSQDTLIDPAAGQHTTACIPDALYMEVDGLGHDLPPGMWERLVHEMIEQPVGVFGAGCRA